VSCDDPVMTHPLDNPDWHALSGPQRALSQGSGRALRFEPEVSSFAALPTDRTAKDWNSLATLVTPGHPAILVGVADAPPDWQRTWQGTAFQLVADAPVVAAWVDEPFEFEPLTAADVPQMLALVERTQPGPFAPRTIELGGYIGLHEGERLVAMAGRRMQLPDWIEISAVCTDVDYRGRGRLVRAVAREITGSGRTPFLHVRADNESALRVYQRLGFSIRREITFMSALAPVSAESR
jgi:predicted GNAT family acetyltransferase